jgi:hypothetical protein
MGTRIEEIEKTFKLTDIQQEFSLQR